jgi:DNA-binding NarL/FixJ family response regulator
MKLLDVLLVKLGLRREAGTRTFELDAPLHAVVSDLAEKEQRPPEEIASNLMAAGLAQQVTHETALQCWQSLSRREQDVTALACLGYTNKQIGARLGVSPDTVKGYVRQVLVKFRLHSKDELRMLLKSWDFSGWGQKAED